MSDSDEEEQTSGGTSQPSVVSNKRKIAKTSKGKGNNVKGK